MHKCLTALIALAVVAVGGVTSGAGAVVDSPLATTTRGTIGVGGALPNGASIYAPALSNDGRYITFTSRASNLVPGDTNGIEDAFLYDRLTGTTERISVSSNGTQGNLASVFPVISTDARYVGFFSNASNLDGTDVNGPDIPDVYLRDRKTNTTILVSRTPSGTTGNGYSVDAQISLDGRYLAYFSNANNIIPGDPDGLFDIYVYEISTGITTRVPVGSEIPLASLFIGTGNSNNNDEHPVISADGRFVAFQSAASNLTLFGDTNNAYDVFVHDRLLLTTRRASVDAIGGQANSHSAAPAISADGRFVAFHSGASNLVPGDTNGKIDVFVKDMVTGLVVRLTGLDGVQGNGDTINASMDAAGRLVAATTAATNLVSGNDTTGSAYDAIVWNLATGSVSRVSVNTAGEQANGPSVNTVLSPDGLLAAFISGGTNLVSGDTNEFDDVFLRDSLGKVIDLAKNPPDPDPGPVPPDVPDCVFFDLFNTSVNDVINCLASIP